VDGLVGIAFKQASELIAQRWSSTTRASIVPAHERVCTGLSGEASRIDGLTRDDRARAARHVCLGSIRALPARARDACAGAAFICV
jgi:hypothetical protein